MSKKTHSDEVRAHSPWLELVAPYLDDELSEASAREMDTHLSGCSICQREAAQQRAVADRLRALRAATPAAVAGRGSAALRFERKRRVWSLIAWAGWGVAAAQAAVIAVVLLMPSSGDVPMVDEAVAHYHRVTAGDLPLAERDTEAIARLIALPIEPLKSGRARFLGGWRTELRGETAAALAYRVGDRVVIQYVVSESLFFAQSRVREAVARSGRFISESGKESVVAWPGAYSGFLLVGNVPASELVRLTL